MKIAILAPSPVPFSVGGAEKLWWGLQNHLNQHTCHPSELIKIPVKEHTFWDLIESYYSFYQLDLSHFDLVISGKYPGWMAHHPNHHIYMLHCLRGLYDTYPLMNLPFHFNSSHPKICSLLTLMDEKEVSLQDFFEILFQMKEDQTIPQEAYVFPGPFIRRIVHFLDRKAMAKVQTFAAISQTVANRVEYYPEGTRVKVIYPASPLKDLKTGPYDYFFTVGRLDGPKRIRMLLEAYLQSKTDIPLKVAGTGPLGQELKDLCQHDPRIEFLGFVSDQDLIDYYAHALAVIFVPYDEDYGFITIEAMMSEKPVITFTDSGGVTEFVEDGKTGFLCRPDISQLRSVLDRISHDKENVISMGKRARKKVETITWEETVGNLLDLDRKSSMLKRGQNRITVVSTYPIYPPRGGGQNRVYHLYKELAKSIAVEVVSLTDENGKASHQEIASHLWETRIPKSRSHAGKEWEIQKKVGIPVTDIAMLTLYDETKGLIEAVQESSKHSRYVVCAQPYTYPLVNRYTDKKIILDSQNTEYLLKKQMLPKFEYSQKLLETVFLVEKQCCLTAHLVTVCTVEDARVMQVLYGLDPDKVIEVPNGVDPEAVLFSDPEKRAENKRRLGLQDSFLALFMGSWHQPNIDAVYEIFKFAAKLPHVRFLILGSVGFFFEAKARPPNVGFMGVVDDEERNFALSLVDVALNPMMAGSGTNLKMLDYLAAGIPVVSTDLGARGLGIPEGLIETAELEAFVARIQDHLSGKIIADAATRGREFVAEKYDWKVIGKRLADYYLTHICSA